MINCYVAKPSRNIKEKQKQSSVEWHLAQDIERTYCRLCRRPVASDAEPPIKGLPRCH